MAKKNTIGNPNCKYQTIASTDHDYTTYEVMSEYDTYKEAKLNYEKDILNWKQEHDTYHHFGIKELEEE